MRVPFQFNISVAFPIILLLTLTNTSHEKIKGNANCRCGEEGDPRAVKNRVLGGSILQPLAHPSLAHISYDGDLICGGTVVGPHHILTAAHCVINVLSESSLKVLLGVHDRVELGPHVRTLDVRRVIKHERFRILENHMLINDIALLETDKIKFNNHIKPMCLPIDIDPSRHKAAAVAGWGRTKYEAKFNPRLPMVALLNLLSNEECLKSNLGKPMSEVTDIFKMVLCAYNRKSDACQSFHFILNDDVLWAKLTPSSSPDEDPTWCQNCSSELKPHRLRITLAVEGDSGGPLYVHDENDIQYLIGIVSFGVKCGTKGTPGLYTRVASYLDWLEENMKGEFCSPPDVTDYPD